MTAGTFLISSGLRVTNGALIKVPNILEGGTSETGCDPCCGSCCVCCAVANYSTHCTDAPELDCTNVPQDFCITLDNIVFYQCQEVQYDSEGIPFIPTMVTVIETQLIDLGGSPVIYIKKMPATGECPEGYDYLTERDYIIMLNTDYSVNETITLPNSTTGNSSSSTNYTGFKIEIELTSKYSCEEYAGKSEVVFVQNFANQGYPGDGSTFQVVVQLSDKCDDSALYGALNPCQCAKVMHPLGVSFAPYHWVGLHNIYSPPLYDIQYEQDENGNDDLTKPYIRWKYRNGGTVSAPTYTTSFRLDSDNNPLDTDDKLSIPYLPTRTPPVPGTTTTYSSTFSVRCRQAYAIGITNIILYFRDDKNPHMDEGGSNTRILLNELPIMSLNPDDMGVCGSGELRWCIICETGDTQSEKFFASWLIDSTEDICQDWVISREIIANSANLKILFEGTIPLYGGTETGYITCLSNSSTSDIRIKTTCQNYFWDGGMSSNVYTYNVTIPITQTSTDSVRLDDTYLNEGYYRNNGTSWIQLEDVATNTYGLYSIPTYPVKFRFDLRTSGSAGTSDEVYTTPIKKQCPTKQFKPDVCTDQYWNYLEDKLDWADNTFVNRAAFLNECKEKIQQPQAIPQTSGNVLRAAAKALEIPVIEGNNVVVTHAETVAIKVFPITFIFSNYMKEIGFNGCSTCGYWAAFFHYFLSIWGTPDFDIRSESIKGHLSSTLWKTKGYQEWLADTGKDHDEVMEKGMKRVYTEYDQWRQ